MKFTSDLEFYAYDDHANTQWGNGAYDALVQKCGVLNSTNGESSNRSMLIGTYPGGDAYTHEFVINGGTVSTPYGFIGVGWQSTHASMTLNSGLVSTKGLIEYWLVGVRGDML